MTNRVRVFLTLPDDVFGFTTEVDVDDPMTVDGLEATALAVARYNEWFDIKQLDFDHTVKRIEIDHLGLPLHAYEHIVIHGGELISFEHHLDLDAYRAEHGLDPDRCEACAGVVQSGKACIACGLIGDTANHTDKT